jgi:multiple sugar transport system substrate-binding protein
MVAVAMLLLSGCSSMKNSASVKVESKVSMSQDPITLKVYMYGLTALTDEEFKTYFADPVRRKYPNITLEAVASGKGVDPPDLLTAGDFPDIVLTSVASTLELKKLQVLEDISPLIKKNGININRFEPVILDSFKWLSDKGEVFGLPYSINFAALFYNKDIFDKFGVPYPKDGMNWDDALVIARKLTQNVEGVQYMGIETGGVSLMGFGLSLPYVDRATNKAVLLTDSWKMVLAKAKEFYEIPGMTDKGKLAKASTEFFNNQRLAAIANWGNGMTGTFESMYADGKPLNWDMVTIPNFKEAKGYSREADYQMLEISETSKYKEQAFQVIDYITSDDVQQLINKKGRLTALQKTEQFKKTFAADLPSYKGKNMNAIFSVKPANMHSLTEYDKDVRKIANNALLDVVVKQKDMNTALRDANDAADKLIQSEAK